MTFKGHDGVDLRLSRRLQWLRLRIGRDHPWVCVALELLLVTHQRCVKLRVIVDLLRLDGTLRKWTGQQNHGERRIHSSIQLLSQEYPAIRTYPRKLSEISLNLPYGRDRKLFDFEHLQLILRSV